LDHGNASDSVLLATIYAAGGKWDLSGSIQQQRKDGGVKKQLDCTWIEVNNEHIDLW
jgi:hypothetical protein